MIISAVTKHGRGLRPFCGAARMALAGLCLGLMACPASGETQHSSTPHSEAVAALADTRAAIDEIVRAADLMASDPEPFRQAAQRAIDTLAGSGRPDHAAVSGEAPGALGHLNWLLHRPGSQRWNAAVQGAWVHVTVAVGQLHKALSDHGLDEYQEDVTGALEDLEMAVGRDSTTDALGGLEGALATTDLAVPDGATIVSGCRAPTHAPAYGVAKGYLLYVAIPTGNGSVRLPQVFGVRDITLGHGFVVVHTAAAAKAGQLCGVGKQAAQHRPDASGGAGPSADPPAGAPPKLYTEKQAEAGKAVFMQTCSVCHGLQLEGKSAPPNAGMIFLSKAQKLGWSVSDMRTLVVSSMPLNNPASLSPGQYADVLAFLLASDCYPAGATPFPTRDTRKLKATPLAPVRSADPDNPQLGTCRVE